MLLEPYNAITRPGQHTERVYNVECLARFWKVLKVLFETSVGPWYPGLRYVNEGERFLPALWMNCLQALTYFTSSFVSQGPVGAWDPVRGCECAHPEGSAETRRRLKTSYPRRSVPGSSFFDFDGVENHLANSRPVTRLGFAKFLSPPQNSSGFNCTMLSLLSITHILSLYSEERNLLMTFFSTELWSWESFHVNAYLLFIFLALENIPTGLFNRIATVRSQLVVVASEWN